MKRLMMSGAAVLLCAGMVAAQDETPQDKKFHQHRLSQSAAVVTELRGTPDKGIPETLWAKADCVVVIPSVKKAAFVVGGEYGKGVLSCRNRSAASGWSAPLFMTLAKGSWGAQIGGQEVDLVLLVMNRRGVDKLLQDKVTLGADAAVAAGPVGRDARAATDAQMGAEMLSYSRAQGVFAGIDLSGGVLRPDKDANASAYGENVTARDIIAANHVTVPAAARGLMQALSNEARGTSGRK